MFQKQIVLFIAHGHIIKRCPIAKSVEPGKTSFFLSGRRPGRNSTLFASAGAWEKYNILTHSCDCDSIWFVCYFVLFYSRFTVMLYRGCKDKLERDSERAEICFTSQQCDCVCGCGAPSIQSFAYFMDYVPVCARTFCVSVCWVACNAHMMRAMRVF